VGGLVATVAMTAVMLALGDDSPPPTAALWAKFVGDEGPEAYRPQGMALHFLTVVGAVVWMRAVLGMDPDRGTAALFALFHVVYGVVLGAFVVFGPV
jgi:hypothetical protein